jgi:hypothetical protein
MVKLDRIGMALHRGVFGAGNTSFDHITAVHSKVKLLVCVAMLSRINISFSLGTSGNHEPAAPVCLHPSYHSSLPHRDRKI